MTAVENDLEPRAALEAGLTARAGRSVRVAGLSAKPLKAQSTHPIDRLAVTLDTGERLRVIFKRLVWGPENKQPWREPLVYRRLLAGGRFGAPELYASVYDEAGPRYWLFLEDVGGESLADQPPEVWEAAARRLGELHGTYLGRAGELRSLGCLRDQDERYFRAQALAARRVVQRAGDPAALARFDRLLAGYPDLAAALARQPRTLVHGDVFAHNFMVQPGGRIRPIDWESAAVGPAAWDLARLLEGWGSDKPTFLAAYLDECRRHVAAAPDVAALRRGLRLCEVPLVLLHVRLCEDERPDAATVEHWLARLDAAWRDADGGPADA